MIHSFISNGLIGEQRLLRFMGAGGPETSAESAPEPVDTTNNRKTELSELAGLIEENNEMLGNTAEAKEKLSGLLAERVEQLADSSMEEANTAMRGTNEYLLGRIQGIGEAIRSVIGDIQGLNNQRIALIEEESTVNVTDPRAQQLFQQERVLNQMVRAHYDTEDTLQDQFFATGDTFDATLEGQEGTKRDISWRKGEGGDVAAAETTEDTEEVPEFVPSPSAEQNAKDVVLAMNIQNGSAEGDVDAAAAFRDLKSEFASLEPEAQEGFVSWMNEQIGSSLPYEANGGIDGGGLRIDRTA